MAGTVDEMAEPLEHAAKRWNPAFRPKHATTHDAKACCVCVEAQHALALADAVNVVCPISGKPISADSLTLYRGFVVGFCNPGCRDTFAKAIGHFEAALAGYEPVDPDETPE